MLGRVAVSLVVHNEFDRTQEMLASLYASDFGGFASCLFVVDNHSEQPFCQRLLEFDRNHFCFQNEENQVNVLPRIAIMEQVLVGTYTHLLEIHTDMLFPREWFHALVAQTKYDNVGIVMPWILNGRRVRPDEIEALAAEHRESLRHVNPTQVLPWLLNLKAVRDVGYYDPSYHPGRCEDDDFVHRMYTYGYKGVATKESVVAHEGGFHSYRKELLPPNHNEQIFQRKFGTTIQRQKDLVHSVHPIILV